MKKILAAFLSIILLLGTVGILAACTKKETTDETTQTGGNNVPDVDMSLRTDTQYGLYWYGDSGNLDDTKRSQENMPVEYYDPSKPTVIYSHGWKTASDEREVLSTLSKTYSVTSGASGNINYVAELKALGYNVAFWDWFDYAKDLDYLQSEIWTIKTVEEAEDGTENYKAAVAALDGRTFAGEFAREVYAVMKNSTNSETVFIGHSFGGQMVTAAAYTLYKLSDMGVITNKNVLPARISLADPYIPGARLSGKMDLIGEDTKCYNATKVADAIEYLNRAGAVIDLNGAMTGLTYDGYYFTTPEKIRTEVKTKLMANTVYVIQVNLQNKYGSVGDVHNISRDFVLTSFIEGKKGNMTGCVPNLSMTAAELRPYVGREFEQLGNGFDISGATMKEILSEED